MKMSEIISVMKDSQKRFGIEGVTYLGGEPTQQKSLQLLTLEIKKLGLGVICFTGRLFEEVKELLGGCDMVIDGAFDRDLIDTKKRIIGSTNQRIIHLSERYINDEHWFYEELIQGDLNVTEFGVLYNGEVISSKRKW